VLDNVELNKVDKANNPDCNASTGSDDRINVGNKANNEQAESMIFAGFETNDASMTIEQELQGQCALDSMEVDTVDKGTDANG
jgi:hypothetical protein